MSTAQQKQTEIGSVPESWDVVDLAVVRESLQYGTSMHCGYDQTAFPVLRIPNIESGRVDIQDLKYAPFSDDESCRFRLERGDLLFIRTNGVIERLGVCAVYDGFPERALFASYLIRARLKLERINPWFLAYFFASQMGTRAITARATPAADGKYNLNTATIDSLPIPLPPTLEEQQQIVAALDAVRRSVRLESDVVARSAELKRAALRTLFTRGLRCDAQKETEIGSVPTSWDVVPLGSHHSVVSGGTPSRTNPTYWTDGTIPWVKTTEVDYCVIRETEEHITELGLQESAAKLLPPGTVLLAMYGQGVTRGKVAILGIEAACNQACAAIRPSDAMIDPKYLYHFLSYRYEEIRQLAHGGQQQNLNLDIVRELPIAFPTEEGEQREIVAILDALDRKIDIHRRKRGVLEDLFRALLHKLMTGEIHVSDLDLGALAPKQAVEANA